MAFNLNIERKESINKCIRFPADIIKKIENVTMENGVSFSQFVIQACDYALKDMDNHKKKTKEKV